MRLTKTNFSYILLPMLLIVLVTISSGCSAQSAQKEIDLEDTGTGISFFSMNEFMALQAYGEHAQDAMNEARTYVISLGKLIDIRDASSDISTLNKIGSSSNLHSEIIALLKKGELYSNETGGLYDMTLLPISNLWQIGAPSARIPEASEIEAALERTGLDKIEIDGYTVTLSDSAAIDPSAIEKGFAIDRSLEIFSRHGIEHALISFGGTIFSLGSKPGGEPWEIGLHDPDGMSEYIGTFSLENNAVVTRSSSDISSTLNGNFYHDIFDPRTGFPASSGLKSVTIITKDASRAEAYATACFIMGLQDALNFQESSSEPFEAIFVTEDNHIHCTKNIAKSFKLMEEGRFIYEQ